MRRRKYPICERCGDEINPHRYDDCDTMYITTSGEVLCRECFLEEQEEYLRLNTKDFARLIGVDAVEVGGVEL